MKKFVCDRCHYTANNRNRFKSHLNRKFPCKEIHSNTSIESIKKKYGFITDNLESSVHSDHNDKCVDNSFDNCEKSSMKKNNEDNDITKTKEDLPYMMKELYNILLLKLIITKKLYEDTDFDKVMLNAIDINIDIILPKDEFPEKNKEAKSNIVDIYRELNKKAELNYDILDDILNNL